MARGLVADLIVPFFVVFALVRGWRHGSLREGAGLLALVVALFAAPFLMVPITWGIGTFTELETNAARLIALLSSIFLVELVLIVSARRRTRDIEISGPRVLDRIGGVIFAAFRGITIAALALFTMLGISAARVDLPGFAKAVVDSRSGAILADPASLLTNMYDSFFTRSNEGRALTLAVRQQTSFAESEPTDRVRFEGATEVGPALEAERQMFELLNEARVDEGLERLEWCERCAEVARSHPQDMYTEGFFSHVNMDGLDPFERMQRARITYQLAGENLAVAPSPAAAHDGLMASADHRANILRREFDEVGIGVFEGPYGLMCTEVFRAAP
ncbi:MAG: CvpA family protein [Actinomycetota bacterium]